MDKPSTPLAAAAVGERLNAWADEPHRIVALLPDGPRTHGEALWDALQPSGLLQRTPSKYPYDVRPRNPAAMNAALGRKVPAEDAALWIQATLINKPPKDDGDARAARAGALAHDLAELLGPDADWRSNGGYGLRHDPRGRPVPEDESLTLSGGHWAGWCVPVTTADTDAAIVGRGAGHCLVIVTCEFG
ncbi:hypothetical protein ACIBSV_11760 [Embleya sp. NPDC050154]|uniref:hypothetical protein n=1 Tax=Embleya sp. NPDC050154 TaxID=3363988 RepID=UPI0037904510